MPPGILDQLYGVQGPSTPTPTLDGILGQQPQQQAPVADPFAPVSPKDQATAALNAALANADNYRSPDIAYRSALLPMSVTTSGQLIPDGHSGAVYGIESALPQLAHQLANEPIMTTDPSGAVTDAGGISGTNTIGALNTGAAVGLGGSIMPRPAGSLGMFGTETAANAAETAASAAPSITAYHGSPHSFDAFDMSKIGTGEGAQAYGHGLYFAENENVAKSYRDALAGGDGHMYEVGIGAQPDQFIDWDQPLSQQHPDLQRAALEARFPGKPRVIESALQSPFMDMSGADFLRTMQDAHGGPAAVTDALKSSGIAGVRYLDNGSSTAGAGTRNYVVFDDNTLSILRKYGIAGLLGAGGAAAYSLTPNGSTPAEAAPAQGTPQMAGGLFDDLPNETVPTSAASGAGGAMATSPHPLFDDIPSYTQPAAPPDVRNVPTAPSDPIYHGAVPIAQAPDQGGPTAFASGVGGVPIFGPTILRGEQALAAYGRSIANGTSYDAEQQHVQDMVDAARQQHPGAAFAGDMAGASSAVAPVVAVAPEIFGAGGGGLTAAKVGAGSLSGAAIGGADAALRSGGDPTATVKGVVAGGAGGAAGPAIGAGLGRLGQGAADLYSYLRTPTPGVSRPVADIISTTLANDGQLGAQGLQAIGAAGPRGMLVDASPSLAGVLDGALQHGGPGAAAARQAIEARTAGAGQDMTAALDQAFGPPQGVQTATNDIRNGTAAARQAAYDAAYGSPIDYTTPNGQALEQMISSRVPPGIIARAQNQMRVDGALPPQQVMASIADDGTVTYHQMPDVRMVDYITRSLNDVARAGDGQGALGGNTAEGRAYGQLAQDLRGALRSAVPAYGDALDTAAQPIQARNALDFGSTMLSPTVPRDAVAGTLQGMTGPELAQVRQGVRSHIADTMANVTRTVADPNVDARQAMAGVKMLSSDAANDKLGMLLGPQEQASVATALDQAGQSLNLRASLSRNSATAARQNANQVVQQAAQPGVVKQALTAGGPLKATRPVLQAVLGIRPQDIAARETAIQGDLASALTSPANGAGSGVLDSLIRASQLRNGASSVAGSIPYGALTQTGIFSLLPALQAQPQ